MIEENDDDESTSTTAFTLPAASLEDSTDDRAIELSSIAAIYPELLIESSEITPDTDLVVSLEIAVSPVKPLSIQFLQPIAAEERQIDVGPRLPTPPPEDGREREPVTKDKEQFVVERHALEHLPPLKLRMTLPPGYPHECPPRVELYTLSKWLSAKIVTELQTDCERLWNDIGCDQVIYTYIDHLQQQAESAFGLSNLDEVHVELSGDLKLALLDFDLKKKREHFERETFDCGVCLEPKKGANCHRLLQCGHVFCVACLQDFYNNCIVEGDIDSVKCPAPKCDADERVEEASVKKRRRQDQTLNPSELLQIPIKQELVQRYVRLKRKKKLEANKNTIYCPRPWCQGAARSEKRSKPRGPMDDFDQESSEDEDAAATTEKKRQAGLADMADRLVVCEDCNFAFCRRCYKSWHGTFQICMPLKKDDMSEEDKMTLAYLERYSTPCPTCNAPSQKSHGCNHMICFKCKTHFCYLCSAWLMPDNPYKHFNDKKLPCYMRLWELEQGDGANVGHAFAGGEPAQVWEPNEASDDEFEIAAPVEEDDSSDDEEPAPDVRRHERDRPMHIEIVNFARAGAANQRIALPQRPRVQPPPPPAPNPPRPHNRRRGRGQQANRQRAMQYEPHRQQEPPPPAPPAPLPAPIHDGEPPADIEDESDVDDRLEAGMVRHPPPPAAPGQGNGFAAQQPAPVRAMGLERFLQLAQQDQEDEWDSDELDEDFHFEERVVGRGGR